MTLRLSDLISVTKCVSLLQTQRKVDVTTLKENIGKLKAQIVESPEELKSEMEKMKEKVKAIKNSKVRSTQNFVP